MKLTRTALMIFAWVSSMGWAAGAIAANGPNMGDRSLEADKACTTCHNEGWRKPVLGVYQTKHGPKGDPRTPGCQTCHGASADHRADPSKKPGMVFAGQRKDAPQAQSDACLTCHNGGNRTHWEGSAHPSNDVPCASCHEVHRTSDDKALAKRTQADMCFACHKTERAQSMHISRHPIQEGKVTCSDCHNPHGSVGPKLVKEENVRDTCFTCHAEKRGPFLHEHASATDDCMNCHTPHGSTNYGLLKGRMPWLCQECHADSAPHPGTVYSGNNLPGGAQANANLTGGLRPPIGSGATFAAPIALNAINPVTGAPITSNAGSAQLMNRGCVNCHSQIHGSNHPGGQRFTR